MTFHVVVVCSLLLFSHVVQNECALLKTVSDHDLPGFINTNEYLGVLFVGPDCEPCKDAEKELGQLLSSETASEVTFVRVLDSNIPQKNGLTGKPSLIFYRQTKPVIYDGVYKAASVEEWIALNRESELKRLNDDDFEHLTQAATGATTGDWLVFFCDTESDLCGNLGPVFETIASKLKGQQKNVAFVDKATSPGLAGRFHVDQDYKIIFFRLGNMYEYAIEKLEVASIVSFALSWYKNVQGVKVPVPPSPFDALLTKIVGMIEVYTGFNIKAANPVVLMGLMAPFVGLAVIIIVGRPRNDDYEKRRALYKRNQSRD